MKTGKIILAAVAALALSASPALAYEVECVWTDETRTIKETRLIKVNYDPAPGLLCEVQYDANGSGERRLWWAKVERDFCEERARELADKFRNEVYAECAEKDGGASG